MSKLTCSGKNEEYCHIFNEIGVPECIKRYPKPLSVIQVLVNVKWLTDNCPWRPPAPLCTSKTIVEHKKGYSISERKTFFRGSLQWGCQKKIQMFVYVCSTFHWSRACHQMTTCLANHTRAIDWILVISCS